MARARDSLVPAASEVDSPQAVLAEIPAVMDSVRLAPSEVPDSALRDLPVPANGAKLLSAGLLLPLPRERDLLAESDAAAEVLSPTVLV
jgi:hypothetical protein